MSLGDTEEVRGQICSHPDFQVFMAYHVAAIVFAIDIPLVGFMGWLQRSACIPCYNNILFFVYF